MRQSRVLFPRSVCGAQRGFTLVEVMVALMIVAIALPALMFQMGSQLEARRQVRDQIMASWVAQEQLSLLTLQQAAVNTAGSATDTQGQTELGGRRWYWQLAAEATSAPGLYRHTIRVALSADDTRRADSALFSLDAYLPVRSGAQP